MRAATVLFTVLLTACTTSTATRASEEEGVTPDGRVIVSYGLAALTEAVASDERGTIKDDYRTDHPVIATATDGKARRFVFVGFEPRGKSSGYFVIFERCEGDISFGRISYAGFTDSLSNELEQFLKAENNKTADFPNPCMCVDDQS